LAKIGKTPEKLKTELENKTESPVQSSHQGELKSVENEEDKQSEGEVYITSPSLVFTETKELPFKPKHNLNKIISQASQSDLISPTEKDMNIREYI